MKEKIVFAGDELEVEISTPLTLLCHNTAHDIKVPERVEIGPMQTIDYIEKLRPKDWLVISSMPWFINLFKTVFPDQDVPKDIHSAGSGMRHVAGMIIMIVQTRMLGQQPFIQMPESYLHPKYQCNLADLFIKMSGAKNER